MIWHIVVMKLINVQKSPLSPPSGWKISMTSMCWLALDQWRLRFFMVSSRQNWPNSWTQNWAGAALTLLGPCDGCRVAQAKLSSPNAMGQIFYSRFFKTLDQMGSDGQPFWLKWNIGSCGKRWSSTSFSIVRSLLCKNAATERDCEHRHFVYGNQAGLRYMTIFFAANSAVSAEQQSSARARSFACQCS